MNAFYQLIFSHHLFMVLIHLKPIQPYMKNIIFCNLPVLVLTKTKAYLGRPLKLESGCKQMRDHVDLCELIVAFNLEKEYGKDNDFDIVTQSAYERIYNEYYEKYNMKKKETETQFKKQCICQ
ncbi:unnamed protein product [Rotaria socialis]|uniref:Uncharacterized protein n=1 Tax=Rotaria socialis TaxID=392032 RepID=A0A821R5Q7_9BILA|nr:unnamed protein product [Rotaria socialis]CAF4838149.1 unnamed protein product [Rotaria socialis]